MAGVHVFTIMDELAEGQTKADMSEIAFKIECYTATQVKN